MLAKNRASLGEKANFCPFGCTDEQLDENGYCRHLVGFTNDGKTMEPFKAMKRGEEVRRVVLGSTPEPLLPGDRLERITISSRVYRDVDAPAEGTAPPRRSAPGGK